MPSTHCVIVGSAWLVDHARVPGPVLLETVVVIDTGAACHAPAPAGFQ
jgi:hypothetical protein